MNPFKINEIASLWEPLLTNNRTTLQRCDSQRDRCRALNACSCGEQLRWSARQRRQYVAGPVFAGHGDV